MGNRKELSGGLTRRTDAVRASSAKGEQTCPPSKPRTWVFPLRTHLIAAASSLTSRLDTVKRLEDAGIGAVVIHSLFEEQIQLERMAFEEQLTAFDNLHPEMIHLFPELEHGGPQEHLLYVRHVKESVGIPVIASLNAVNPETWVDYAAQLEQTGADALELNFYATPTDPRAKGAAIEANQLAVLHSIGEAVSMPVSVKLSPFYSNPLNVISQMEAAGVAGFVLFNRFFQPEIDIDREQLAFPLNLSREGDYGLALRFAGLLFGDLQADVCGNTGISSGENVVKMILAGAACVEIASMLYRHPFSRIGNILQTMQDWMDAKGHATLADFRGKLSRGNIVAPWAYTRAQYVKMLLKPEPIE